MNVAVIGTGYIGLVTAACLAEIGHTVIGMDDDPAKIAALQAGEVPIYEPHLTDLIARNRAAGRLQFTDHVADAVQPATVVFICVNTPPLPTGEADLSYVEAATRRIAAVANGYTCIVQKSTVPVQTGQWVERTVSIYAAYPDAEYDIAANPEFTREGLAVEDFLHPDRLVLGVKTSRAEQVLRELYAPIIAQTFPCPIHDACRSTTPVSVLVTTLGSAELIKHAANAFLALKISYANLVADVCDAVGADVQEVVRGIGLDHRIGPAFLNAGLGFGGSCFPKDLKAFAQVADSRGVEAALLREVDRINDARIDTVLHKLKAELWILKGKTIGLLGLAFKPGTDDMRCSPALALARRLLEEGVHVKGVDPKAKITSDTLPGLHQVKDPYDLAAKAEALVLCTEWPEFQHLDWARIKQAMVRPLIIDARNALDRQQLRTLGFHVLGLGR